MRENIIQSQLNKKITFAGTSLLREEANSIRFLSEQGPRSVFPCVEKGRGEGGGGGGGYFTVLAFSLREVEFQWQATAANVSKKCIQMAENAYQ